MDNKYPAPVLVSVSQQNQTTCCTAQQVHFQINWFDYHHANWCIKLYTCETVAYLLKVKILLMACSITFIVYG